MEDLSKEHIIRVRETELLLEDTPTQYREKLARITLNSMVQFVGLLDAKGTVLEINKVALDAVGIKLSDVEGKPFWTTFWWQVSEEINAVLRDSIARAALGEFVRWDAEIYGRAGGKETIIIDASLCPVFDDQGKVVFLAAEGRDITEKKQYEQEIAHKNVDLQALLERISELDEIKTQFFSNVSHELRTPLSLIIGPAERLIKSDVEKSPGLIKDSAQVILRNARMLLKHVNNLLDISKLDAGKLKIELHRTDLAELIRFVSSHFELLAHEKKVRFDIDATPTCIVTVDIEKLQRIVMNLLSNAFKFVPDGGQVRCSLEIIDKGLIISVEDSGPGIKQEQKKLIFERFRQVDGTASRQFSGTGLGLAIAYEFVEMHKGTIEVLDSELGGALFQVKLPASYVINESEAVVSDFSDQNMLQGFIEELQIPDKLETTSQSITMHKETILVVEDNIDMNRFITQSLSSDYHVISAFDGQEGLDKAAEFPPTLILCDIMMPKVSGVEMIAELRKRPEMSDTPIVILSAKADDELKFELLEENAQDFITKPFSERELQIRVKNLIAVRKSNEILRNAEKTKQQNLEDLEKKNTQLTRINNDLDNFVYTASHDLIAPISNLEGLLNVFTMDNEVNEDQRPLVDMMFRSIKRFKTTIKDLTEISKIQHTDQDDQEVLSFKEILDEVKLDIRMLIETSHPIIETQLSVPEIHYSRKSLRSIIYNLLSNSMKYASPDRDLHIKISTEKDNGFIILKVADNGLGISKEDHSKIFEMFKRIHDHVEGTGIGLYMIKKMVENSGGKIELESEVGKGTTFMIYFKEIEQI